MDGVGEHAVCQDMSSRVHPRAARRAESQKDSPTQSDEQALAMRGLELQPLGCGLNSSTSFAFSTFPRMAYSDSESNIEKHTIDSYEAQLMHDANNDSSVDELRRLSVIDLDYKRSAGTQIPSAGVPGCVQRYYGVMADMLNKNNFEGAFHLWSGLEQHERNVICHIRTTEVGGVQNPPPCHVD